MNDKFKEIIKDARVKKGYSQRRLARMVGLHHSTYNDIENNKIKKVDLIIIIKLCNVLDLDLSYVLKNDMEYKLIDDYFYNKYKK